MTAVSLTAPLAAEYQRLFDTCDIRPDRAEEVEAIVAKISEGQARYRAVSEITGVPWHFIALVHQLECSGNFSQHLHNGDPLTARTVHEPPNRPTAGKPPFSWEESAEDALRFERLDRWQDWSLPGTLYRLEGYNGWGYRLHHPETLSPYLWAGSNHYESGKYVQDGRWSPSAVSRQIGTAVLLRRMAETGMLESLLQMPADGPSLLRYSPDTEQPGARALQAYLNTLPGLYVKVDGKLGPRSSEAFRKATGRYLPGDPREGPNG